MDDIAIVGMACRFPGAADLDEFRRLLTEGRSGLTTVDASEGWVPVVGEVGTKLDADATALGLSDVQCELLDPQHRVFLECARDALDHAGHGAGAARGEVGVYAGAGLSGYLTHVLADRFVATGGADPVTSLDIHTANVAEYLALRTAYSLDLRGPAVSIGATCATSLAAVHVAAQALLGHECDTALAGGVTLLVPRPPGYVSVPEGPFSPDGRTRAYSRGAAGTVFTDGAGVVVLRRLEDALADGDTIHAVVRGSALTNDGADKVGFTAPSPAGQVATMSQAHAIAGVEAEQIGLVEGHGTATPLGDRIEIESLVRVFDGAPTSGCALGSVKTNIGHTGSAAGVAGLIKATLAVRDGLVLPTLDADPVAELEGSPFVLPHDCTRWEDAAPRRAQVNSFGIGGTNVCVVLEQPPRRSLPDSMSRQVLPVSAHTPTAARSLLRSVTARTREEVAAGAVTTRAAAATLVHGRAALEHRAAAVVAPDGEVLAEVSGTARRAPRVVFAFPGAGGLTAGGCADLLVDGDFAAALHEGAEAIVRAGGPDVLPVLTDPGEADRVRDPATGLPALFVASTAIGRTLRARGVHPDATLGHSVGEYAAAVCSGVLDLDEAATLVVGRSAAMSRTEPGRMLAVGLDETDVRILLREHHHLDLAAVNGPGSCVVAGPRHPVERLHRDLRSRSVRCSLIDIDAAAHSRLVEPAEEPLARLCNRLRPQPAGIPLYSTLYGRLARDSELSDPHHWVAHLRSPVRFAEALDAAIGDGPTVVIGCGPGTTPVTSARSVGGDRVILAVGTAAEEDGDAHVDLLETLASLWCAGVPVTWSTEDSVTRVPLPTYPYERRRHEIEPPERGSGLGVGPEGEHTDQTHRLQLPTWQELPPADEADPRIALLGDGPAVQSARTATAGRVVALDDDPDVLVVGVTVPQDGNDGVRLRRALLDLGRLARRLAQDLESLPPVALVQLRATEVGATLDPVEHAVRGAVRVLGQELQGLVWRAIEIDPDAVGLDAELHDLASGRASAREVSLTDRRRRLRTWRSWRPRTTPSESAPGRRVLVVGGLGAVGLHLAAVWTRESGAQMVLASRRGGDRERWSAAEQETLESLRSAGADVRTVSLDAADRDAVFRVVSAGIDGAPFDLIVHAPVDLDLVPLAELDERSAANAVRAKVDGAGALAAAVDALNPEDRPHRVVLMSSAAGTIGGFGLGGYVAASRYLDALAHQRHAAGWLAVDWDRFRLGTAAEAESVSELTMRHAITLDDGVRDLEQVLSLRHPPAQVAVSPAPLDPRSLTLERRTVVDEGGGEALRTPAEELVARVWSEVLGREIASRDDDFFARGGHSLLATRVLALLRERTGATFRLKDLLAASTVAALAERLADAAPDAGEAEPQRTRVEPEDDEEPVASAEPEPSSTAGEAPFAMTRVQNAYLLGRRPDYPLGGVACHFFLEIRADDLDTARYERAWRTVIARHGMLRTVVDELGRNHPLEEPPEFVLDVLDLTAHSERDAAEALVAARTASAERVADPGTWPLVRPTVVALPDGTHRVLLSVDVLVCDSASWMLVDRELRACYSDPQVRLPEPTTTFAACVAALEERDRARGSDRERAWEYWGPRVDTLPGPARITGTDEPSGRARFVRLSARLPARTWDEVKQQAAGRRTTPTAHLLSAYGDALERWSGQDHFSITLTVFDRPDVPGAEGVVGEFSSLMLLERRPVHGDRWARSAAVQEQLLDDLDHRSVSGLEVLAAQARATGRQANVPVVFTSMLGLDEDEGGTRHDHEWLGPVVSGVSQTPQVWLDHQAFEHRGDLVLQWDVNTAAVDLAETRAAFADYVDDLGGEIRSLDAIGDAPAHAGVPEGDPGRRSDLVRVVWAELLGVDPTEIDDERTFLELGGDSLLAVRMAARLRESADVVLRLDDVRADITVPEVVRALSSAGDRPEVADRPTPRPDAGDAPFALTTLQQAYYVGQQGLLDLSVGAAHVVTSVPLRGTDPTTVAERLQLAVDRLVARHPMLRVAVADGSQRIRAEEEVHIEVAVHDFRWAPADLVDESVQTVCDELAAGGPDAEDAGTMALAICLEPHGHGHLVTSFSLLAVDGWSSAVIERELLALVADPDTVLDPLSLTVPEYLDGLGTERAEDMRWWLDHVADPPTEPVLPHASRPRRIGALVQREGRLDPVLHDALREQARVRGVTVSAVALAAWAVELGRLTGNPRALLTSLVADRRPTHPDVPRLVGPLSTTTLLDVDLSAPTTITGAAERVARSLTEASDHLDVSAVEVGRELTRRAGSRGNPAPVVVQSTLGMDRSVGSERPHRAGPLGIVEAGAFRQTVLTPQVDAEVRFFEIDGELVVSFAAVDGLHEVDLVDDVVTGLMRTLDDLAAGRGWDAPVGGPVGERADTDLLATIRGLWSDLLGADVGAEDDFFALGGDSLLAVRMLGRVTQRTGVEVSAPDFLASPTPATLARITAAQSGGTGRREPGDAVVSEPDEVPDDAVITLRDGDGDPLFLLHPSGGDVLSYLTVARLLRTDRPVVAVADPGLLGHPWPEDLAEVSTRYAHLVDRLQPEGPITLGGWSMGGTIAHEVARRLRRRGREVAGLIMVDSTSPERIVRIEGLDRPASEHAQRLRFARSVSSFLDLPGEDDELDALCERLVDAGAFTDRGAFEVRFAVFARHLQGLAEHGASRLDASVPVMLLRATDRSPVNSRVGMGVDDGDDDLTLGWQPFVEGTLTVRDVPGHHYSLLRDAGAAAVAHHLTCFLQTERTHTCP